MVLDVRGYRHGVDLTEFANAVRLTPIKNRLTARAYAARVFCF